MYKIEYTITGVPAVKSTNLIVDKYKIMKDNTDEHKTTGGNKPYSMIK